MPAIFNLPDQYNGDSLDEVTFNFYINDTNTSNNISTSTPKIQIRNKKDLNTVIDAFTIGSGLTLQNGNQIRWVKSSVIDWGAGTYLYDLQVVDGGKTKTYLKGQIKVLSEITV